MALSVGLLRQRFLHWATTDAHTQFTPEETQLAYTELKQYLLWGDNQLTQPQRFQLLELFFHLSVYSGHDSDAYETLQKIKDTLGIDSAKIKFLQVILMQCDDGDNKRALEQLGQLIEARFEYNTDMVSYVTLAKKLVSMQPDMQTRCTEALKVLEKFPMDPELWWFMHLQYCQVRQWEQAIFCLQEVILIVPLNYVAHSKLSELFYYKYVETEKLDWLHKSLEHSLRAVELSETYLQPWCFIYKIAKILDDKPELLKLSHAKIEEISQVGHNEKDRNIAKQLLTKLI